MKIFMKTLLFIVAGILLLGFAFIGRFLPDILGVSGDMEIYVQIVGFIMIFLTVALFIALLELRDVN